MTPEETLYRQIQSEFVALSRRQREALEVAPHGEASVRVTAIIDALGMYSHIMLQLFMQSGPPELAEDRYRLVRERFDYILAHGEVPDTNPPTKAH